ncbi:hypothetical protein WJX79_010695 [Trebouxia sp. C0005]
MLGYIQKDQGQTHYEILHSNIPEDVLWDAHEAYQTARMRTDFTENRMLITEAHNLTVFSTWRGCQYDYSQWCTYCHTKHPN